MGQLRQIGVKLLPLIALIILLFYAYLHSLTRTTLSPDDYHEARDVYSSDTGRSRENAARFFNAPITCKTGKEKRNFVYIKVHKTGSDTLSQIFRAFGYNRNLSFVFPKRAYWINWPDQVQPGSYYESKTGEFNILCEHVVLNITKFKALMPEDSVYIASIRDPFARYISAFEFFNVSRHIKMTDDIPARKFMTNPDYFQRLFKSECEPKFCYPIILRNGMSYDLGFRAGHPDGSVDWTYDQRQTDQWLKQLDETLDLVLINEHFDESLVLLRRRMCWSTKDILYISRNVRHKNHSASDVVYTNSSAESSSVADKFYAWSAVDVKLYKLFAAKLWQQVAELEDVDTFWDEVADFKAMLPQVSALCAQKLPSSDVITLQAFDKTLFTVARNDCYLIYSHTLFNKIRMSYNVTK
jgi:hypothetical protein